MGVALRQAWSESQWTGIKGILYYLNKCQTLSNTSQMRFFLSGRQRIGAHALCVQHSPTAAALSTSFLLTPPSPVIAVIANCVPKIVAITTSLITSGPRANTQFLGPIRAHNANGISISSAVCAQTTECPYTLQWDTPSPLKIAPSHGVSGPNLIHSSLVPPESSTQRHLDRFSRFRSAH